MEIMKYEGEWYVWTILFLSMLIVIFMPKRNLTWAGLFITILFSGGLTWIGDTIVGSVFDLFTLAKKQTVELTDSLLISFVPAGIASIYVNFYKPKQKWVLAIIFTLLCFFLELGLVKVGYMKNHQWETWYGIFVYFIAFRFFFPWYLRLLSTKLITQ
jgi:hypothetical protein